MIIVASPTFYAMPAFMSGTARLEGRMNDLDRRIETLERHIRNGICTIDACACGPCRGDLTSTNTIPNPNLIPPKPLDKSDDGKNIGPRYGQGNGENLTCFIHLMFNFYQADLLGSGK